MKAALGCLIALVAAEASALSEESALVQSSARAARSAGDDGDVMLVPEEPNDEGEAVVETKAAPIVFTELGPIKGVHEKGYDVFKDIPYAEPPLRFEPPVAKKSWGSKPLRASRFGSACIGSGVGAPEDEDCLKLHVWRPRARSAGLPVVVYFHGGMNQHGSGQEPTRQGDGIVQSGLHPVIFVGLDFRLGVFGWLHTNDTNTVGNLGLLDQQEALRFVKRNIAAFGGDPNRVTLQGQSEGAHNILAHLVAPGSAGLFSRVVLHSPAADIWSRDTNKERTEALAERLGCLGATRVIDCLRAVPAQKLWDADWFVEDLDGQHGEAKQTHAIQAYNRFMHGQTKSVPGYLGWQPVADGVVLPGEPRELIHKGQWNKVPVLMTVTMNESHGIYGETNATSLKLKNGLTTLLQKDEVLNMRMVYNMSLIASGIWVHDELPMMHMMMTDKMWTCDVKALAADIERSGGQVFVGMFAHKPKYDPDGEKKNPACVTGAACHASDMLYVLPQGRGKGIHGEDMQSEVEFSQRYSEDFLAFVYGEDGVWVPYDNETKAMVFYETQGPRVVPGYRNAQCKWLDTSTGQALPKAMTDQAFLKWMDLHVGTYLRKGPARDYRKEYFDKFGGSPQQLKSEMAAKAAVKTVMKKGDEVMGMVRQRVTSEAAKAVLRGMFPIGG